MKIAKDLRIYKGLIAEFLGCLYLLIMGYKILKWNFKVKATSQIDIVALKNNQIHLIEVKYRKKMFNSSQAIAYLQQQRLKKSTSYFTKKYQKTVVIDLLAVSLDIPFIKLYKNIF